jgi:hypothetical protein
MFIYDFTNSFFPQIPPFDSDIVTMGRLIDKEPPYEPETPLRLVVVGLSRTGTACKLVAHDSLPETVTELSSSVPGIEGTRIYPMAHVRAHRQSQSHV